MPSPINQNNALINPKQQNGELLIGKTVKLQSKIGHHVYERSEDVHSANKYEKKFNLFTLKVGLNQHFFEIFSNKGVLRVAQNGLSKSKKWFCPKYEKVMIFSDFL